VRGRRLSQDAGRNFRPASVGSREGPRRLGLRRRSGPLPEPRRAPASLAFLNRQRTSSQPEPTDGSYRPVVTPTQGRDGFPIPPMGSPPTLGHPPRPVYPFRPLDQTQGRRRNPGSSRLAGPVARRASLRANIHWPIGNYWHFGEERGAAIASVTTQRRMGRNGSHPSGGGRNSDRRRNSSVKAH
jgi:hypothetical protein